MHRGSHGFLAEGKAEAWGKTWDGWQGETGDFATPSPADGLLQAIDINGAAICVPAYQAAQTDTLVRVLRAGSKAGEFECEGAVNGRSHLRRAADAVRRARWNRRAASRLRRGDPMAVWH